MLVSLLACLPLPIPQQAEATLASPFDQVVELEFGADDEALIEGRGPTHVAEYECEFAGTLHIWTHSELDLFLRVDDAMAGLQLGEDDDSGGGKTPYLRLGVNEGDFLAIFIAAPVGGEGSSTLHLMAAPETPATRDAAALEVQTLAEAERLLGASDLASVRELLHATLESLEETVGSEFSEAVADWLGRTGYAAFRAGAPYLALEYLSRDRAHCERTLPQDHPTLLATLQNQANAMVAAGDLSGVRLVQEIILASCERTLPADHPELSLARMSLARSLHDIGDLSGARALQTSVLEARERTLPPDHQDLVDAQAALAATMWSAGDVAGARALQESVLEARERTLPADHPDLLTSRANLALSMSFMGDYASARALQESVLEARRRTRPADDPYTRSTSMNLAITMSSMGDYSGARTLQEADLETCEGTLPADHPELLAARHNLGVTMSALGDLPAAQALLPALCAGMRARVLAALSLAPRQARQTVRSEWKRLSTTYYWSEAADSEHQAIVFELTETMRLVASESARSLTRFDADPELAPILAQTHEVRRELNNLMPGAGRGEDAARAMSERVTRLSLERDRLEGEVSRRLMKRGVVTRPIEAEVLVGALDPQDALVGYRRLRHWERDATSGRDSLGAEHLVAHVLSADGSLTRVDLGPAEELERLATTWRTALGAPLGDSLSRGIGVEKSVDAHEPTAGVRVRERILDPILRAAGDEVARLFVCPDDLIFSLPLDALPMDASGEQRLGDRVTIVGEVSFARLMVQAEAVQAEASLLVLGGVDYRAKPSDAADVVAAGPATESPNAVSELRGVATHEFQDLPEAREEVESIAGLFQVAFEAQGQVLKSAGATKSALFEAAVGKRYVHLATHGWFAPEIAESIEDASSTEGGLARMGLEERVSDLAPMTRCGLALAGANHGHDSMGRATGILTAEQLCSIDLSLCELAVLSACETSAGIRHAGQGIQSLQAALYAAGARASITSLWRVEDNAARSLMERFYSNLWLEGMGKSQALWEAKKTLRAEGQPPANWAGWVLTGNPD